MPARPARRSTAGATPDAPPRFSIVVAALNAERTIAACLRSALAQTLADFELIVVDNHSTDATAGVAQSIADPRLRLVSEPQRGIAAAKNRGIATARGSVITFLDSDDLLLPDYLEAIDAALARHPDAALVYTDAWVLNDRTGRIRRRSAMAWELSQGPASPPATAHEMFRRLIKANFVFGGAAVSAAALRSVGVFDQSISYGEDWELWLRLAAAGCLAVRAPGRHAVYRAHDGQTSANELVAVGGRVSVLEKLQSTYALGPADRSAVERALGQSRRRLAIVQARGFWQRTAYRTLRLLMRVRSSVDWHRRPPRAVAAAFPDLGRQ
jgi:GT2 family glycosyltransferase